MRFGFVLAACAVVLGLVGCSNDDEAAKRYAEEQARKITKEKVGTAKVVQVPVPVAGGKHIDCTDLFPDIDKFGAALPDKVRLHQLDHRQQTLRQPGVNAICEFIREGKRPTAKEQEKMSAKTERLGVLPGDPYCEIRVDCGRPAQKDFESKCRTMPQHTGNRDLGVFACVMQSQRAERDAYRYKFFEPDTGCYLDVLGGPSVAGTEIPSACAKVALDEMTAASIAKYK